MSEVNIYSKEFLRINQMKKCELCDTDILNEEIHINENNINICCMCVLSFHKVGIENNLLTYDSSILDYLKRKRNTGLFLQIIVLLAVLIIIYINNNG